MTRMVNLALPSPIPFIRCVADGFAALKLIHGLKPDLMILDYQLPHMSGLELYDQLRSIAGFENIPVIFTTANSGMAWQQLKKRKVIALSKPFELATMHQTIEKLLSPTLPADTTEES